jgi:hypothetical protein
MQTLATQMLFPSFRIFFPEIAKSSTTRIIDPNGMNIRQLSGYPLSVASYLQNDIT